MLQPPILLAIIGDPIRSIVDPKPINWILKKLLFCLQTKIEMYVIRNAPKLFSNAEAIPRSIPMKAIKDTKIVKRKSETASVLGPPSKKIIPSHMDFLD